MSSDDPVQTYSMREVSEMLDLSARQIRGLVADGALHPERGERGKFAFSFQDLVILRAVAHLVREGVAPARVRTAVVALQDQIEEGRDLTEVSLTASGRSVVASDDEARWEPETGQVVLALDVDALAAHIEVVDTTSHQDRHSAGDWYAYADSVEATDPLEAEQGYRNAIALDPAFADAHLNLGRLLHAAGTVRDALIEYEAARDLDPTDPTTHFNIGVASQDLGEIAQAVEAYETAIELAPRFADARYNLAALYEQQGETAQAVQQLREYKDLIGER